MVCHQIDLIIYILQLKSYSIVEDTAFWNIMIMIFFSRNNQHSTYKQYILKIIPIGNYRFTLINTIHLIKDLSSTSKI